MDTLNIKLWLYMSGDHGCMPDSIGYATSLKNAVESVAETFGLGRTRKAELKKHGLLRLNHGRDGAEYASVEPVDLVAIWRDGVWTVKMPDAPVAVAGDEDESEETVAEMICEKINRTMM